MNPSSLQENALLASRLEALGYETLLTPGVLIARAPASQTTPASVVIGASAHDKPATSAVLTAAAQLVAQHTPIDVMFFTCEALASLKRDELFSPTNKGFLQVDIAESASSTAPAVSPGPRVRSRFEISGFTAHGARPHLGINAVDAACLAATAIHMVPRPSMQGASITILSIDAGGSSINMIPGRVVMTVEIRSFCSTLRQRLTEQARAAVVHAVASVGATVTVASKPLTNLAEEALRRAEEPAPATDRLPDFTPRQAALYDLADRAGLDSSLLVVAAGGEHVQGVAASIADAAQRLVTCYATRAEQGA